MNTSRKILYKGVLHEPSVETHALSPFFNYGQGFFETILYEKGKLHLLDRHLERMRRTCSVFSIRLDYEEINEEKLLTLLEQENLIEHCSRIKILYAPVHNPARWDTVVTAAPYTRPVNDFVLSVHDEVRDTTLSRYKSLNYGYNLHWKQHYHKKEQSDEVLFLNRNGHVLEGSYTNLLILKDSVLCFVGHEQNYLQGIMQERVLEAAPAAGLKVKSMDRGIPLEWMKEADEVMICNSLMLVKRVKKAIFGEESEIGVRRWESGGNSVADELSKLVLTH